MLPPNTAEGYTMRGLTGKEVRFTRTTSLSSEYLGKCELCGKHMSEAFFSVVKKEVMRDDGTTFFGDFGGGGVHAHKDCIEELD